MTLDAGGGKHFPGIWHATWARSPFSRGAGNFSIMFRVLSRHPHSPLKKWARPSERQAVTSAGWDVGNRSFGHRRGMQIDVATMWNNTEGPRKIFKKQNYPMIQKFHFWVHMQRKCNHYLQNISTLHVHSSVIHNRQDVETTWSPWREGRAQKACHTRTTPQPSKRRKRCRSCQHRWTQGHCEISQTQNSKYCVRSPTRGILKVELTEPETRMRAGGWGRWDGHVI